MRKSCLVCQQQAEIHLWGDGCRRQSFCAAHYIAGLTDEQVYRELKIVDELGTLGSSTMRGEQVRALVNAVRSHRQHLLTRFEKEQSRPHTYTPPLFLPVTSEVWDWYLNRGKCTEIRTVGQFSTNTVRNGRSVWLSCGYNGPAALGSITGEPLVGSVEQILAQIPFNKIIPKAENDTEAHEIINRFTKPGKPCIAFPVDIYCV